MGQVRTGAGARNRPETGRRQQNSAERSDPLKRINSGGSKRAGCPGGAGVNRPPAGVCFLKEVLIWFTIRIAREPRVACRFRHINGEGAEMPPIASCQREFRPARQARGSGGRAREGAFFVGRI